MSIQRIDIKKKFTDLFNNIAPQFDEENPKYFTYFGKRLVELSGIKEGDSILDVATGRGASLFAASKRVGDGGHVLGIDISEEMVRMTSQEIEKRGIINTKATVMDAENLSILEARYDYVLCGFGIFFFPDYERALQEFRRVLKTNGRCCISTFLRKDDEESIWVKELLQKYKDTQNEKNMSEVQLASPEFDTQEGLYKILNEAGFRNIQVLNEVEEFIFKDEEEWWRKQWAQATRLNLEKLTVEKLEQFKQEAFDELIKKKRIDGIHFKLPVLYAFGSK